MSSEYSRIPESEGYDPSTYPGVASAPIYDSAEPQSDSAPLQTAASAPISPPPPPQQLPPYNPNAYPGAQPMHMQPTLPPNAPPGTYYFVYVPQQPGAAPIPAGPMNPNQPRVFTAGGASPQPMPISGPMPYYPPPIVQAPEPEPDPQRLGTCSYSVIGCLSVFLIILFIIYPELGLVGTAALFPALLLLYFIARKFNDYISKESLALVFFLGQCSVIPAAIVEAFLVSSVVGKIPTDKNWALAVLSAFLQGYIVAACVEESVKLLTFLSFLRNKSENKRSPFSIVTYCAAAALGFAIVENFMYVVSQIQESYESAFEVAIVRAVVSVPLHGICGALTGIRLARKSFFQQPLAYVLVLLPSVAFHGSFDFVAMAAGALNLDLMAVFALIAGPIILIVAGLYMRRSYKDLNQMWINHCALVQEQQAEYDRVAAETRNPASPSIGSSVEQIV